MVTGCPAADAYQWTRRKEFRAVPRKKTAVILILGQSNSSNESKGPHRAGNNVLNFGYIDGKCYKAEDPLVGATGFHGSFASRLGDLFVNSGKFRKVILVPMSVGGSYMMDWAPGGRFHRRILIAIVKLRNLGLEVSHFLFHQSEVEAAVKSVPRLYRRRFLKRVENIRVHSAEGPVYVAIATVCGGPPHPEFHDAQRSLPNLEKGILPGPDTDVLGIEFRHDNYHFSTVRCGPAR